MSSSIVSALVLIVLVGISSASPTLDCGSCSSPVNPPTSKPPATKPPGGLVPPVTVPVPPVTVPPVGGLPPVGELPPVGGLPPVGELPPVGGLPPVGKLPPVGGVLPPVGKLPPVGGVLPPVGGVLPPVTKPTPKPKPKPCAPPAKKSKKCPLNILKLGACANLLGGSVRVKIGSPLIGTCCPVLKGITDLEAAACLCTVLKAKLLNIKVYAPIALEVLISCGKKLPPGYTCPK